MLGLLVDPNRATGLPVVVPFALLIVIIAWFARGRYVWRVGLSTFFYWQEFVGFVLLTGAAYLAVYWLSRRMVSGCSPLAHVAISLLGALFFACGSFRQRSQLCPFPSARPLPLYSRSLWPMPKLVILFGNVGSGNVCTQNSVWARLPFHSSLPGSALIPNAQKLAGRRTALQPWWRGAATARFTGRPSLGIGHRLPALGTLASGTVPSWLS